MIPLEKHTCESYFIRCRWSVIVAWCDGAKASKLTGLMLLVLLVGGSVAFVAFFSIDKEKV